MTTLRPYQTDAIEAVRNDWSRGHKPLMVMATGGGKTVCFASLIIEMARSGRRSMVIAHRQELIRQARNEIAEWAPDVTIGVEMGDSRSEGTPGLYCAEPPQVVVASIQTLTSGTRYRQYDRSRFGLLVIDEAHRSAAPSYRKVIDYFATSKVVGVTATPARKGLGDIYDSVACDYGIRTLQREGYLVPLKAAKRRNMGVDLSGLRTRMGDFADNEVAAAMMGDGEPLHAVALDLLENYEGRRTIVFCANVDHAMRQAAALNYHKPGVAVAIHASTENRKDILARFESDSPDERIICNCGVLTEGFDSPGIEIIAMCRPTKSQIYYAQAVGRGTRVLRGVIDGLHTAEERRAAIAASAKPCMYLYDYAGITGKVPLESAVRLLASDDDDEKVVARAEAIIDSSDEPMEPEEALERARNEVKLRPNLLKGAKAKVDVSWVDVFEKLKAEYEEEHGRSGFMQFEEPSLTADQRKTLEKHKLDPESMPRNNAIRMAGILKDRDARGLASWPQVKLLQKQGYKNADMMTKDDAKRIIGSLAKNGWKPIRGRVRA